MLGEKAQPEVADYQQLKYLMRCVNESIRLYPHPPVLLRRAQIQDELPGGLNALFWYIMAQPVLHHACIPADAAEHEGSPAAVPAVRSLLYDCCVAWLLLSVAPVLQRASAALQGVSQSRWGRMS